MVHKKIIHGGLLLALFAGSCKNEQLKEDVDQLAVSSLSAGGPAPSPLPDVYLGGSKFKWFGFDDEYEFEPVMWKNNVMTKMPYDSTLWVEHGDREVLDITIVNGNVYAAGYQRRHEITSWGLAWKNGSLLPLPGAYIATGIAIGEMERMCMSQVESKAVRVISILHTGRTVYKLC